MGLLGDNEELKSHWSALSPAGKSVYGFSFVLSALGIASLADSIFALRGFIKTGIEWYRSVTGPINEFISTVFIELTREQFDLAMLCIVTLIVLVRAFTASTAAANKETADYYANPRNLKPDPINGGGYRFEYVGEHLKVFKYGDSSPITLPTTLIGVIYFSLVPIAYLVITSLTIYLSKKHQTNLSPWLVLLLWISVPVVLHLWCLWMGKKRMEHQERFRSLDLPLRERAKSLQLLDVLFGLPHITLFYRFAANYTLLVYFFVFVVAAISEGLTRPFAP